MDSRSNLIWYTIAAIIILASINSCRPEDEPYQACIYGNTKLKQSQVWLNDVSVNFSHASIFFDEQDKLILYLEVIDVFPLVFNMRIQDISMDSGNLEEPKMDMSLGDCDVSFCSVSNRLLEGDSVFAEFTQNNNIHVFLDARIINTKEGLRCREVLNQSFDTAHFVMDLVLEN